MYVTYNLKEIIYRLKRTNSTIPHRPQLNSREEISPNLVRMNKSKKCNLILAAFDSRLLGRKAFGASKNGVGTDNAEANGA